MDQSFRGFAPESFTFFRELAQNNNKAWFDRNRGRYETFVTGAFRSLLATLEPFLLKLNPNFEVGGKTNGNLSRINRDIRFSKDKSPYKSNYYLYVYDGRKSRDHAGRLYVGLSAECLTVGFSIYGLSDRQSPGVLETVFRPRITSHSVLFRELLQRIVRQGRFETYWHRHEKREWVLHPGLPRRDEDWQTLGAWIVRRAFAPDSRAISGSGSSLKETVESIFARLYPLHVFTSSTRPRWQAELRRQQL